MRCSEANEQACLQVESIIYTTIRVALVNGGLVAFSSDDLFFNTQGSHAGESEPSALTGALGAERL